MNVLGNTINEGTWHKIKAPKKLVTTPGGAARLIISPFKVFLIGLIPTNHKTGFEENQTQEAPDHELIVSATQHLATVSQNASSSS